MESSTPSPSGSPPLSPKKKSYGNKSNLNPGPPPSINSSTTCTSDSNSNSNIINSSKGVEKPKAPSTITVTHTPPRSCIHSNIGQGQTNSKSNASSSTNRSYPYSSMSPRVTQQYIIERTQSSPCVLDASPKTRVSRGTTGPVLSPISTSNIQGPVLHHTSQLTPVTRNTNRTSTLNKNASVANNGAFSNDKKLTNYLSVPETNSLNKRTNPAKSTTLSQKKNATSSRNDGSNNHASQNHAMIRPRTASCVWSHSGKSGGNGRVSDDSNRPLSPPSWSSHRATNLSAANSASRATSDSVVVQAKKQPLKDHNTTSTTTATNSSTSNSTTSLKKDRFSSPLDTRVKLDRNHYSFDTQPHPNPQKHVQLAVTSNLSQQSSPESRGTPTPSSPEQASLFIPYQPSRDSSLASFGVVPEDLDDIFLPLRTTNKFRRSSKDKVVFVGKERGGFGVNSINTTLHSSRHQEDEFEEDSVGEEDSSTHISDSQSGISIPSIQLGARIRSGTQDSLTTMEDIEERSFSTSTFDEDEEFDSRKKKSNGKYLSARKEKQVYEWLRTLEVDRDNNEYVAEAASSKFLTGKMNNGDYLMDCRTERIFPTISSDHDDYIEEEEEDIEELGRAIHAIDTNKKENEKDPKDASSFKATKTVMGRNLGVYGSGPVRSSMGRTAKNSSGAFKVSGLYR